MPQVTFRSRFSGKERDAESGLDYFGARYYASGMGRFMSPDWATKAEAVPYAKLEDPQSLNLYSYVLNNPFGHSDLDGHQCDACAKFGQAVKNLVRVSTSFGAGREVSGSFGGVKITAGASTKTTTTTAPLGNAKPTVENTIESGVKVQVANVQGEVTQKTALGEDKGTVEGKGGVGTENTSASISTQSTIPVAGFTVPIGGAAVVGAEVSISTQDAVTAMKTFGPAITGTLKAMTGSLLNGASPGPGSSSTLINQIHDYLSSH